MLDKIHLTIQGGRGGRGCESYYHRTDHKSVPNGADGGDGGSVIFCASHNAPGLDRLKLKQHLIAESGEHGGSVNKRGRKGADLIVLVPLGTSIYNRENHLAIRDLCHEGETVVVAKGGRGGVGNIGDKIATPGEEGELLEVDVEFRIIADVFLVGLPSSGKSSLLHHLTRANVEGKDYPFATRSPVLGVYGYDDYKQINFCELPSIYEGSTQGRGLGTDFLKHLARAKLIVFMLDTTMKYAATVTEGLATLHKIAYEHQPALRQIPSIVVVNKIDLGEDLGRIQKELQGLDQLYFLISVKTGEGVESLLDFIKERIESEGHV
ncbi:MAG TPA: 50S ribosome-binding GTPase [Candidatus Omnitrophota bacterium]|nr:50S ribosome-binding GTPase [Candidatus Omnitrophota bacterium]HPS36463.1 50S ribosome-binding GTPase [Candidatus Omnitrophota bacterium]